MIQSSTEALTAALEQAWTLLTGGEPAAARLAYEAILRSHPLNHEAIFMLGIAHVELKDLSAALHQFREITRLDPSHADGWRQRGLVSLSLTRFDEAAICLREFILLSPDDTAAHFQYGYVLACLGRYRESSAVLTSVLAQEPDNDMAHYLHAMALLWTGDAAGAKDRLRRLIETNPNSAPCCYGLGFLHLLLGEYAEGWPLFEWRAAGDQSPPGIGQAARWDGRSDIRGKTLLIYDDAAFGDMIQFCRFAPLATAAGARVILLMPSPLTRLMTSLPGVDMVVGKGTPLPTFDLTVPVMSLPLAFGITLDTLPAAVPYLWPMARTIELWKARLAHLPGFRVGLVWAAAPRPGDLTLQAFSQRKSMALTALAPLATVPEVTFVSLQVGEAAAQARQPPAAMTLHDFAGYIQDFEDTAGLIANLDLVISVDTSVAHLAGAMGRPVWLMNPFDTDWRWMLDRDDCPWYPSLRIFRQPAPGDWDQVVRAVTSALKAESPKGSEY